ncbi:acyl-CoA N-acyltransferase [Phaeosphaeriaceae sp. PMI808]|nr:acyl-CoA N-acyltransferase [Phaeosphaeriaceae sp. PMI808]
MSCKIIPEVRIRPATFPADNAIVKELFLAYAQSIPIKLDFQGFDQELASLPGKYAEDKGGIVLLAYLTNLAISPETTCQDEKKIVGVVALRAFPTTTSVSTCELKRLYLVPSSRGLGLSKHLMHAVLTRARDLGYTEILLDTLESMTSARKLYESYGFVEIEAYYASIPNTVCYKLVL